MNGQQPQQDPPITYEDPQMYILWLRRQRLNYQQIEDLVRRRFGSGQTPDQQKKEQASKQQQAGFAQVGGMIGGLVAGRYVMKKAGQWFDQLTGNEVSKEVVDEAAKQTAQAGTTGITEASNQAWNAGADAATSATPEVISSEGGMSTIKTPDGGTQQVPTESLNDSQFWSNVNWGQVAQGGLALAQMYGAYKSFKAGDKFGGGVNMAAGAGNLAAATGATAGTTAGTYVIPGLNILAGAYGGYQTAQAMGDMAAGTKRTQTGVVGGAASGAAIGAGVGSIVPGLGTAIGAGIGAAVGATAGAIGSWTGSHKGKAQFMRDNIRGVLQQNGILDDKFQGTLADGTKVNMGLDGSHLKWKNLDKIAENQPKAWNAAVPAADALAASYGFVGQKASDIAAWYAHGAVSNAGDDPNVARANMQHFAKQQGITMDLIKTKLDEALKDNRINQDKYNYYMGGAQQLLGGAGAAPQQQIQRPGKGEVVRTSPGMYMNDKGVVSAAPTMKAALERNYQRKQSETTKGK